MGAEASESRATLVRVLASILGYEPELGASFFDLGGDSIQAIGFVTAARDAGYDIAVVDVFTSPTIGDLLARARPVEEAPPAAEGVAGEDAAPLSLQQEHLLSAIPRYSPDMPSVLAVAFALEGPLDEQALAAAVTDVALMHPALRTTLERRGGELVQMLADDPPFELEIRTVADDDLEAQTQGVANSDIAPDAPALAALTLLRTPRRRVLIVRVHHLVADVWSFAIALRDLSAAYEARLDGRPRDVRLPWTYGRYARDQRERQRSGDYDRAVRHWVDHLEGSSYAWGRWLRDPNPRTFEAETTPLELASAESRRILEIAQSSRAPIAYVTAAVSARAILDVTGQDDIVSAGVTAQRDAENARDMGYFAAARVSRAREALRRPIVDVAADLWEQQLRAPEEVHPDDIALAYSGDQDYFELFANLANEPRAALSFRGCRVSRVPIPAPVRFPRMMSLNWIPTDNGYTVLITRRVEGLVEGVSEAVGAALIEALRRPVRAARASSG